MSVTEALFILGFSEPVFSETILKDRFRELVKKTHPDRFQSFTEQSLASEEFIRVKEAYDVLLDHIRRKGSIYPEQAVEQQYRPNPERGIFHLPDWVLIHELEKALSFIHWLKAKNPIRFYMRIPALFKPVQITEGPGFLIKLVSILNLFQLGVVTFLFATSFVIVFLLAVVAFCAFLLFIPAFFFYQIITQTLYALFGTFHGFKPSAYCGNKKGEIAYLTIRSVPVILIDISYCFLLMHAYLSFPLRLFWPLGTGLILWLCILNLSVAYEWICQYRLRLIRRKVI